MNKLLNFACAFLISGSLLQTCRLSRIETKIDELQNRIEKVQSFNIYKDTIYTKNDTTFYFIKK